LGFLADAGGDAFDPPLDIAVRAFQQQRGLLVDGIVGPATYRSIKEASYGLGARTIRYQPSALQFGDDIAALQVRLQDLGFYLGLADGCFGVELHEALVSFQRETGISPDGICGARTIRALELLGSHVTGGSPHAISEEEIVRRSGPQLSGKRIAIDPGLGGMDTGIMVNHPGGGSMTEAGILWDLASRIEGRMTATGMDTFLTRSVRENPSNIERASRANSFDADLTIALRCDANPSPQANGVACFHFGNSRGSTSAIGQVLSGLIQREIVARTPLGDCRTHGRTWDLLRLTDMPTVQIDLGYLTNQSDVAVLTTPRFRDVIAEAVLIAIKRLYLLGQDDAPTGTFSFAEVLAQELSAAD
jgi:N-acetylmuramoyl-L-alanine amidase